VADRKRAAEEREAKLLAQGDSPYLPS
jgi:hypothetical protein